VPVESLSAVSCAPSIVTMAVYVAVCELFSVKEWCDLVNRVNPLESRGNFSATSNNNYEVDKWAVTFGTARRDWAGQQSAQAPACCTKCNSLPINGQCTNHSIAV